MYGCHRIITHIEHHELRWNFREDQFVVNNRDLRVKYLLNELSEEEFKKTIQQREKTADKKKDIAQILRMFSITASDMLRQMVLNELSIEKFCKDIEELKNYTNDQFVIISKRYTSKKYCINKDWEFN